MAYRYENAPITEALIDIRVRVPSSASMDALEGFKGLVDDRYPVRKRMVQFEGQVSMGDQVGASASPKDLGLSFASKDGKQIFQVRLDGFTFSHLRPYGTWNELRDEAHRLWDIYREQVHPSSMARVAVRYINQIDIPQASIDYKEYFRTTPEVSPDLPQFLSSYFMRLQFPQVDFGGLLVLTQAAVPPPAPDMASVILDIDVFKDGGKNGISEDAWQLLEQLRERKNKFFEGCLTDKTRALFGVKTEY